MKRLIALLLLFAFASCYIPTMKALLKHNVTLADIIEDSPGHKNAETNKDKKDIKACWSCLHFVPQEVTNKFSYIHNAHSLGDNPLTDILTPPPNYA